MILKLPSRIKIVRKYNNENNEVVYYSQTISIFVDNAEKRVTIYFILIKGDFEDKNKRYDGFSLQLWSVTNLCDLLKKRNPSSYKNIMGYINNFYIEEKPWLCFPTQTLKFINNHCSDLSADRYFQIIEAYKNLVTNFTGDRYQPCFECDLTKDLSADHKNTLMTYAFSNKDKSLFLSENKVRVLEIEPDTCVVLFLGLDSNGNNLYYVGCSIDWAVPESTEKYEVLLKFSKSKKAPYWEHEERLAIVLCSLIQKARGETIFSDVSYVDNYNPYYLRLGSSDLENLSPKKIIEVCLTNPVSDNHLLYFDMIWINKNYSLK